MLFISVTELTSHPDRSEVKLEHGTNIRDRAHIPSGSEVKHITRDTSHPDRSEVKLVAPLNIPAIFSTFDTSHLDKSSLNFVFPKKADVMKVTALTSQSLIWPCFASAEAWSSHHPCMLL